MVTRWIPALLALVALTADADATDFKLAWPLGLQEQAAYVPADNPLTPEKIALGKKFFWDKRWSRNGTIACVSCQDPNHGWADPRQFSRRFDGKPTPRHSPTLVNRLFSDTQEWAGTRASLEDQALKASDQTPELLLKNLGSIAEYQAEFKRVFGTELNPDGVAKAIAAYERTILSGNSLYDRFRAGDQMALPAPARRGLRSSRARLGASAATPASTSPTRATTTSGSGWRARLPTSGATPSPSVRSTRAPSRLPRFATSPAARPTCTTAACGRFPR